MRKNAPMIIFTMGIITVLTAVFPYLEDTHFRPLGFEVLFGTMLDDINFVHSRLPFSFWALTGIGLPLLAGIAGLFQKRYFLISTTLFFIGFFFLFTLPANTPMMIGVIDSEQSIDWTWNRGLGLVAAMIITAMGAVFSFVASVDAQKSLD